MVEVHVCVYYLAYFQVVVVDKMFEYTLFGFVAHPWIHHGGIAGGFVPKQVSAFAERIECKALDVHDAIDLIIKSQIVVLLRERNVDKLFGFKELLAEIVGESDS